MAFQESVTVRNARLDAEETAIGTAAVMKIFSGAEPANCAAADPTGLLITLNLPSDWLANASGGSKAKSGTWSGTATAAGTAASWRIYDSGVTACHYQGNVTLTGSGGDLQLDNTNIQINQVLTINTFTITAGNA